MASARPPKKRTCIEQLLDRPTVIYLKAEEDSRHHMWKCKHELPGRLLHPSSSSQHYVLSDIMLSHTLRRLNVMVQSGMTGAEHSWHMGYDRADKTHAVMQVCRLQQIQHTAHR